MPHPATRATLLLEDAVITAHAAHPGNQHVLRLQAPTISATAEPGQFVHLRCDPRLPLRRPMSIMRADAIAGWIDILYKAHGYGTRLLARRVVGEELSLIGPIGMPFKLRDYRAHPLLIGGGVGIPPMIFLAEHIKRRAPGVTPLVLMGSEVPFPFAPRLSRILVEGLPPGAIAAMPLLEDWGIPSRLASGADLPGCFHGMVTDLARAWLASRTTARDEVEVFACGPTPMLRAVAELAREFGLPCQVSVEEYMACGVGGCAACAVAVATETGPTMKRVCVDGPVFDAQAVFPG